MAIDAGVLMAVRERIDIQTNTPTQTSTGTTDSWASDVRWCDVRYLTAQQAIQRYGAELDKRVIDEFWFRGRPTISMRNTRFVWKTDGSPNENDVYQPRSSKTNVDGEGRWTIVTVEFKEEETA